MDLRRCVVSRLSLRSACPALLRRFALCLGGFTCHLMLRSHACALLLATWMLFRDRSVAQMSTRGLSLSRAGFFASLSPLAAQVFVIKIRLGSFAWTVYRRFSNFRQLSDALRKRIPDVAPCPPKRVLGAHTPAFLEQRRLELLDWVRVVRFGSLWGHAVSGSSKRGHRSPPHMIRTFPLPPLHFPLLHLRIHSACTRVCDSRPRYLSATMQRLASLASYTLQLAKDERVCRSAEFHEFLRAQANVRMHLHSDMTAAPALSRAQLTVSLAPALPPSVIAVSGLLSLPASLTFPLYVCACVCRRLRQEWSQ